MSNALREVIEAGRRIVFFGGAGVSTESGIPDFRSAAGLYNRAGGSRYAPEEILSRSFFDAHPEDFFAYYRTHLVHTEALPNPAHVALANLERTGRLSAVFTQNIDGLHQAAGSRRVLELHGSVHHNTCLGCGRRYGLDVVLAAADTLVVGGTSLQVYPAAGLVRVFAGRQLVLINRDATDYDGLATLTVREPIGQALGWLA